MSATKQDSLPLTDATAIVFNSGDSTKKVRISAASVATGTTRVLTVQDLDGTIAILSQPATFTTIGGTGITASTSVVTPIVDSGSTAALLLKTNNGSTQAQFVDTSSTVNFATLGGAATGVSPLIGGRGEAATGVNFFWGTGTSSFRSDDNTVTQFQVLRTASATRNITVTGSNGGNPTISTTAGSLAITPSVVLTGGVSGAVAATGGINTSSSTSAIGYASGAGGTVTQLTSKATAVTLNTLCGTITMNGAALGPNTTVSFFVNNTSIGSTSIVHAIHRAIGTQGAYIVQVSDIQSGVGFRISVLNSTAGSLSEAISLTFIVFICVTS